MEMKIAMKVVILIGVEVADGEIVATHRFDPEGYKVQEIEKAIENEYSADEIHKGMKPITEKWGL